MSFSSWLRSWKSAPARSPRTTPRRRPCTSSRTSLNPFPAARIRPSVEALEDRTLLSTLAAVSPLDSGAGSLRQAILDAAPGDTITLDPALAGQTIALTQALRIDKSLTIEGPGPDQLALSGQDI